MGYYMGGDYYRAGDYYAAGGILGTLGNIAKGVAGIFTNPVGTAVNVASGLVGRTSAPAPGSTLPPPPGGFSGFQFGPLKIGTSKPGTTVMPDGTVRRRRRRMNYGNVKALRRADRRIDGFVGVARKALKHTNYKVVSKSAGARSGSRGVITRTEASRALRS